MASAWRQAIIVGASSGIGEELARQLVAGGCRVALVARRHEELERIAHDLNTGAEARVLTYSHDVKNYAEAPALLQKITHELGGCDLFIYAAGVMPVVEPNEYCFEKDQAMIEVNVLGAIAWINEIAQRFAQTKRGTLVGISSVAGERGRMTMPAYTTSKAALTTYLEAIRNRIARYGVKVVTVKPGPVKTPMTEGLKMPLMIPAERAAREILRAAEKGRVNAFVPGIWRWIFLILRNIPSFIFRKAKL